MKKTKGKVFVGMSGGVDSSVSAYLLKQSGYEVIGVFIRSFNLDGCEEKDAEDARRAAEIIGVPFYVWDFEKEYKKSVVDYMINGYRKGMTPNPDVMCNKEIKFGIFFNRAMKLGADFVATGHYARLGEGKRQKAKGKSASQKLKVFKLLTGVDTNKDQSYFLWTLTQKQLSKILFPIGGLTKPEVRKIAKKSKLNTAEKKDSQGICFLGKISLKDFLKKYLPTKKGNILNESGKIIGEHDGAWFYTIGQRHGLNFAGGKPYYVSAKNNKKNEIVVSLEKSSDLFIKKIKINSLNWVNEKPKNFEKVLCRVRYRQPLTEVIVKKQDESIVIEALKPIRFVAVGQSVVFYDLTGQELLGGGIIVSAK